MDADFFNRYNHIYEKVLLITPGDLFAPKTSFVYGLAHLKLGVAVVSTYRLTNEFYGRHPDDNALINRMVTEGAHEIGHLYGLEHCENPACIMYCPNNLDDLDRKRKYFCGKCRLTLESRIRGGVSQAGSYVDEHRMRFDFTHFAAMTPRSQTRY